MQGSRSEHFYRRKKKLVSGLLSVIARGTGTFVPLPKKGPIVPGVYSSGVFVATVFQTPRLCVRSMATLSIPGKEIKKRLLS
jgi:hypothetical protein